MRCKLRSDPSCARRATRARAPLGQNGKWRFIIENCARNIGLATRNYEYEHGAWKAYTPCFSLCARRAHFRKCFLCSASVRRLPSDQKKRNIQPCQSILDVSPSVNLNLKMPNGRGHKSQVTSHKGLVIIPACRLEHKADRDFFSRSA